MKIENFKGIRSLEVTFGGDTLVSGRNATGKTTVMDAFTWCLFGKDSKGRTTFSVKTIGADGDAIPRLEHSAEVELSVNGLQTVTFRRTLSEEWVKPRGKAETEFKGNTTHYLIDGVEVKASDYQKAVDGIISEGMFRMIASPKHFTSLPWQDQRQTLVGMSGEVTYASVAHGEALEAMARKLEGKDIYVFRQALAYRKKSVKSELDTCPTKVTAIRSVTPKAQDWTEAETRKATLKAELDGIDTQLMGAEQMQKAAQSKRIKIKEEIHGLKLKQIDVVNEAEARERQRVNLLNTGRDEMKQKAAAERRALGRTQAEITALDKDFNEKKGYLERIIASLTAERDRYRTEWAEVNGREFQPESGEVVCPLERVICRDATVLQQKEEARQNAYKAFCDQRDRDLDAISEKGKKAAAGIRQNEEELARLTAEYTADRAELQNKCDDLAQSVNELTAKVADMKPEQPRQIWAEDIPEWAELQKQIDAKQAELDGMVKADIDGGALALNLRKQDIYKEIHTLDTILNDKAVIERNESQIAAIEEREKELAQQLADIEKEEYEADTLEKARMEAVESRVNGMFRIVRFRMFERLVNGGEQPTCVATVDGVPYPDLNDAMKINAGIDIINALCRHNGVGAPIFIDNAESVNELELTESQTVRLAVSEQPQLTIQILN